MPTFGITVAGGSTFPTTNDRAILSKFTAPASGVVTQINQRFHSSSTGTDSFKGLIYAADGAGGIPGTRLGIGAATGIPAGGGDIASTGLSVAITGGVSYWIGSVVDAFSAVWECDAGGVGLSRMEATTYASPAATWTESGTGVATVNVYATYVNGPTIDVQPANQRINDSEVATFSVSATTSGGAMSYQWKRNGSNVGTNSASYSVQAFLADNGALFTVDVTDSNGTVVSSPATLEVRTRTYAKLNKRQSTTFDYSPGGWFGIQAGTTPAGMFDKDMILAAGAGGLSGQTNESVALTDSQDANALFGVARAESVALSDAQTASAVYPVAEAESVALSDAQTASLTVAGARAESVALTDAQTASMVVAGAQAESVALSDSQSATGTYAGAAAESVAVSDSQDATVTSGGGLNGQTNESVALTDSQSAQAVFVAQRDESVALADTQTAALVTAVAQAESVALTDSQSATSAFAGVAAESVALTDSQNASAVFGVAQAESVALADSQSAASVLPVAAAEVVALADSQDATVIAAGTNQVDESFGLGDAQDAGVEASTVTTNTPGSIRGLAAQWRGETPEEKRKRWALIEAEPIEPELVKPDPRPLKAATLAVQVATLKAQAAKYEAIATRQREALKAASDLEKLTAMYAELERQANAAQAQAQAQIDAMNQAIEEEDVAYVMSILMAD